MGKILIPIDFSVSSRTALLFGQELASVLDAELLLVHVAPPIQREEILDIQKVRKLREQEDRSLAEDLQRFVRLYPNTGMEVALPDFPMRLLIRRGNVVHELMRLGMEEEVDLLLIGVRAHHSWLDRLWGSVTARLLRRFSLPMLIVPEAIRYKPIKDIAYATDLSSAETASLKELFDLADQLQARLHRVHVNPSLKDDSGEWVETMPARSLETRGAPYAQVVQVQHHTVKEGLDFFLQQHAVDLLALYSPRRIAPERWIHRSLTRRLLQTVKIPLLVLRKARNS